MSKNNNKINLARSQKGFTIVEVMIVLAVAGLILAVVFVAVPALQRNQRNSSRKQDVAYIKAQLNTLVANNGGQIPPSSTGTSGGSGNIAVLQNGATQIKGVLKDAELNYLGSADNDGQANVVATPIATGIVNNDNQKILWLGDEPTAGKTFSSSSVATTDLVVLVANHSCNNKNILGLKTIDIALSPASRNIAILYLLEGDDNLYCEDTTL